MEQERHCSVARAPMPLAMPGTTAVTLRPCVTLWFSGARPAISMQDVSIVIELSIKLLNYRVSMIKQEFTIKRIDIC